MAAPPVINQTTSARVDHRARTPGTAKPTATTEPRAAAKQTVYSVCPGAELEGRAAREWDRDRAVLFDVRQKAVDELADGEFDHLAGAGKPLNLDEYFSMPEDLRMAYSLLKNANCAPVEVVPGALLRRRHCFSHAPMWGRVRECPRTPPARQIGGGVSFGIR